MKAQLLTRFFPVPKILKIPAVGLDLSSDSLKFAEIREKRGHKFRVEKFGTRKLPEGVIAKGEIKNEELLTRTLSEVCELNKFKYVSVSIPEEKAFVFTLTIPSVGPKELRSTLELQLEEHIPLPAEEVVFDYDVTAYNEKEDMLDLNVSVIPREVVSRYVSAFQAAGLIPLIFETEAQALARAVIPHGSKETYLITDFGQTRTGFTIYSQGAIVFTATLDFGGKDIVRAIMKQLNIGYGEAEEMIKKKGLRREKLSDDVFSACIASLAVLKDEIHKYVSYWESRVTRDEKAEGNIEKVIFTGGLASLSGFPDFLSEYLEVPFEIANPWINILSIEETIPPINRDESLKYSVSLGLALLSVLPS